jgi:hypothetical protein
MGAPPGSRKYGALSDEEGLPAIASAGDDAPICDAI